MKVAAGKTVSYIALTSQLRMRNIRVAAYHSAGGGHMILSCTELH